MIDIRPQPGAQERFLSSSADVVIYGGHAGSGKSYALAMEPLRHIGNRRFAAVTFRSTYPQIMQVGGLWTTAEELYLPLGAVPRQIDLSWRFPSGAKVRFDYLDTEKDKYKHQGAQIPLLCFDELTHFSEAQFFYMLSRNRSTCGIRSYCRATCNPDADSWVAKFIDWWWDDASGLAIPERSGVVRWFQRVADEIVWGDSPEHLRSLIDVEDFRPLSATFVVGTIHDNPALLAKDPGYLANLQNLPYVERERLLGGNWKVRAYDNAEWPGDYFKDIWADWWPGEFDLGAIAVDFSKGRTEHSDYSAIVFAGLKDGIVWVDADIARRPAPVIATDIIEMHQELLPDEVFIEANANQDLVMTPEINQQTQARGIFPLPLTAAENRERKDKRIYRLGPYLKNGKIRLRPGSRGCQLLEQQLRGFPLKDIHDDGPDALAMAVERLRRLARRKMSTGQPDRLEV